MNRLIVHGLMKINEKYLVLKRTKIKRGKPNALPEYWDIPGGMVERGELPQEALVRESKEEVGLDITIGSIIHEDSNYDHAKETVFTRLVYLCGVVGDETITLQEDEHSEYRLIDDLSDMQNEKVVDYLENIFKYSTSRR